MNQNDNLPGDLIYDWHDDVEMLEGYRSGGYRPTHLGDEVSNGRYRIVHKLGFGSSSTVWLARDQWKDRYVTLKFIIAGASTNSSESRILQHLEQTKTDSTHPGKNYVSSILDKFFVESANGLHLCLVSEPAGCSVAQSKESSIIWMFPMHIARAIVAQAILELGYVHSCGVVHGGMYPPFCTKDCMIHIGPDLHPGNILLQLPNLDALSIDELYHRLGEPERTPITRVDGASLGPEVPSYSVQPAYVGIASDEVTDPRIKIADFGEAFFADTAKGHNLHTPILFRPPELYFSKDQLGLPADVWTLACTLYEILGERPLFGGLMPDSDDLIAEMISTLGPLPQHWWDSWRKRSEFFLEDGTWTTSTKRLIDGKFRPLSERIYRMGRQKN